MSHFFYCSWHSSHFIVGVSRKWIRTWITITEHAHASVECWKAWVCSNTKEFATCCICTLLEACFSVVLTCCRSEKTTFAIRALCVCRHQPEDTWCPYIFIAIPTTCAHCTICFYFCISTQTSVHKHAPLLSQHSAFAWKYVSVLHADVVHTLQPAFCFQPVFFVSEQQRTGAAFNVSSILDMG